ncbi:MULTISPECIES: chorismate mutase [Maricaulis]|uniref:chorismate mutase n=1 Tax=Maricaulis maris (strain MCS10) TaxID=394221 RepID=Q0ALZ8_MARMM|nr:MULTISPECIES: chorismate mutase [Maricaulis]ABI66695.1 Chorismate mutase [Maricaulis maris MCS10]
MTRSPLDRVRQEIDTVDAALVSLLARRHRLVTRAARLKSSSNLAVVDANRQEAVLSNARRSAELHGLAIDLIDRIWPEMIDFWVTYQNSLSDQSGMLPPASGTRLNQLVQPQEPHH